MTAAKEFKCLLPEKDQPSSSCCTCRRSTLILGVVTVSLLGAIVVTLAIVNLDTFKSNLVNLWYREYEGSLKPLDDENYHRRDYSEVLTDVDLGIAPDVKMCRRTRIKVEVIPCDYSFPTCKNVNDEGNVVIGVYCRETTDDFEYYLRNNGGVYKEKWQPIPSLEDLNEYGLTEK